MHLLCEGPVGEARSSSWFAWRVWALAAAAAGAAGLGCGGDTQASGPAKDPAVQVAVFVPGQITDSEVFTGRIQTMHSQEIKARVTGHLKVIHFKEGEDVKKGAPLFDIDSRLYDDALRQTKAQVAQAQAHYEAAADTYRRDKNAPGGVAAATVEQDADAANEAKAAIEAAKAAEATARQNVDYCHITADFDGRISRLSVDLDNDIIADNTTLATLVQLQPKMYAYFDVDERSFLDLMVGKKTDRDSTPMLPAYLPQGRVTADAVKSLHLTLGLANEDPQHFTHPGDLVIANNQLDASTGTIRMWGTFANEREDLEPNMFARVRVDVGQPHEALFVAEAALGSDQGFRYLYVINDKNEAEYTRVDVGQQMKGRVEVTASTGYSPLTKDKRVVVNGLQSIHPVLDAEGKPQPVKVAPTVVQMPRVKTDDDNLAAK
ncbi:MAG TPA: efflux RND transporter periplasmic adaptor subunit [Gemmataceae bacterium]|nr:efflux RND transporter periplasmic adaptor subunit [Gemmataceae bacterium]